MQTSARIARLRCGNACDRRWSLPLLHAPVPGRPTLPTRHLSSVLPMPFFSFKCLYNIIFFTTPYVVFSDAAFGRLYLRLKSARTHLTRTPSTLSRTRHQRLAFPRRRRSSQRAQIPDAVKKLPDRLTIPERGMFYRNRDFRRDWHRQNQLLHVSVCRAGSCLQSQRERQKRIGGLILEVKGDFCHKVNDILDRHGRAEDYIEVSLDSEYRYNPLQSDLDAYELAYSIAALLNNLFGRGKEPFWQQAYTNLVNFLILLHKVAYDYVTLFNVYQCAISPSLLAERIEEAEADRSRDATT